MDNIYKNIEEYNPNKKCKIVIVFDMNANMLSNKKLYPIITELFISHKFLSIYYAWKNIKKSYKNKFRISALTWNEKFELPDGSYSVTDIQDYFKYTLK